MTSIHNSFLRRQESPYNEHQRHTGIGPSIIVHGASAFASFNEEPCRDRTALVLQVVSIKGHGAS
jgi:hypothetical protein